MNLGNSSSDLATIARGGTLVTPLQVDVKHILLHCEIILTHSRNRRKSERSGHASQEARSCSGDLTGCLLAPGDKKRGARFVSGSSHKSGLSDASPDSPLFSRALRRR